MSAKAKVAKPTKAEKEIARVQALMAKPLDKLEDGTLPKGTIKRLTTNEVKTGTAFYEQGLDCLANEVKSTGSVKYVGSLKVKVAAGKRTPAQIMATATSAVGNLTRKQKLAMHAALTAELGL